LGRKNRKQRQGRRESVTRRGIRRSIRYDAVELERKDTRKQAADAPVTINLRRMQVKEALTQLEFQLQAFARMGKQEILVVHGQGHSSPLGQPVLKTKVRDWCDDHPALIKSWREAPRHWGGQGAIVVVLN